MNEDDDLLVNNDTLPKIMNVMTLAFEEDSSRSKQWKIN